MKNGNPAGDPPIDDQVAYWSDWNMRFRKGSQKLDVYQERQLSVARSLLPSTKDARVLEIGCGTGWLSAALSQYAQVVGIDFSSEAIEEARRRESSAQFLVGNIVTAEIPGGFDFILTVDTMAHVSDHVAFIGKVQRLLKPGGTFVCMTQNAFVWSRSSHILPLVKGLVRKWPRLGDLRKLLEPAFHIRKVASIVPAGDLGILRLANSRYCAGVLCKLIGKDRQQMLFERLLMGKELVIVATRRKS